MPRPRGRLDPEEVRRAMAAEAAAPTEAALSHSPFLAAREALEKLPVKSGSGKARLADRLADRRARRDDAQSELARVRAEKKAERAALAAAVKPAVRRRPGQGDREPR